jgi:type IV pilus assembly protein PilB
LCEKCRVLGTPDPAKFEAASMEVPKEIYLPNGCTACANTGYRGRMAIHEVLLVSEDIQRMAVERRPSDEIQKMAVEQGMTTLWQDGLAKVAQGMTSMEEIMRVVA